MGGLRPRFRNDLIATSAEAEGVAYVDVQDPASGTQFRFYDFEYALALQMDGQSVEEIIAWAADSYSMALTEEGVAEFARQLGELGFLDLEPPARDESAPSVSHLVNEAVSQVTALPTRGDRGAGSAYGDFSFKDGDGGEETTADAEWSSANGGRTVGGRELDDRAAEGIEFPAPAPETAGRGGAGERQRSAAALEEFNDGEPTSHWVPPLGPEQKREPSQWAMHLDEDLQPKGGGAAAVPEPRPPASAAPPVAETLMGFSAAGPQTAELLGKPGRARPLAPATPPPIAGAGPAKAGSAPASATERPPALPGPATPPPLSAVTPPPSVPFERRQPPAPEEVVMSAFQQTAAATDAAASAAAPKAPSSARQQFRAPAEPPRSTRGTKVAALVMVLLLAAAAAAYYFWSTSVAGAAVMRVRVLSPRPTAVYRWFDSTGRVAGGELRTLAFEGGGRLVDVLPAGSIFAAGEIIARLQGAMLVEADVSRHRSRLLFYEQMRDSMRAASNAPAARQAEIKIAVKTDLLSEAERALAPRVIRPSEAGTVVETVAKVGESVPPRAVVLKINPGRLRGEFTLPSDDVAVAQRLAFCRIEVAGQAPTASNAALGVRRGGESSAADSGPPQVGSPRYLDCERRRADIAGTEGSVVVELPAGAAVTAGQPLRLARARFDGVFPIPRAAIARSGDTERVFVAVGGLAEARAVTLAEPAAGDEALVAQGLDVGDAVITDAPVGLRDGARIALDR